MSDRKERSEATPGPWAVDDLGNVVAPNAPREELGDPPEVVAEVYEATDAVLIAATPDLLDVVKRIRGWDMLDVTADGPFWKRELDAAIAKAQGDSSE